MKTSYALGMSCGPFVVALLSAIFSLPVSVALVMSLPALAGVLIWYFPSQTVSASAQKHREKIVLSNSQILSTIRSSLPLTHTVFMTVGAAFCIASLSVLSAYLTKQWQISSDNAALLMTVYGIGNLIGAIYLLAKPLRNSALQLLRNVGTTLCLSFMLLAFSHSLAAGLVIYCWLGCINAVFFAVTLAARSEYSPDSAKSQVFMWVAAAKFGATSLGAIVAGVMMDISLSLALISSAGALALALTTCFTHSTLLSANKLP